MDAKAKRENKNTTVMWFNFFFFFFLRNLYGSRSSTLMAYIKDIKQ